MGTIVQGPWGAPGERLGRMGDVIQEVCHAGGEFPRREGLPRGQRSPRFSWAPLTRSSVVRPAAAAVAVPRPASSFPRGANRGASKQNRGPRLLTRRFREVSRDPEKSASWGSRGADSTGDSRVSGADDITTGRSRPRLSPRSLLKNPSPK